MRKKPSHDHEHEFIVDGPDEVIVEFDGDYVYASVQCDHAPVLSAVTSERHDETFYEHGPRCEVTQHTEVKVGNPVNVETGNELHYDLSPVTWENIVLPHTEDIEKEVATSMVGEWGDGESSIIVEDERSGIEYRIDLEVDERREER